MEEEMNQMTWLKQNLDNEKKRLNSARQMLKKNPASYSAKVALQSAENRLADLQQRLKYPGTDLIWSGPAPPNRSAFNSMNQGFDQTLYFKNGF